MWLSNSSQLNRNKVKQETKTDLHLPCCILKFSPKLLFKNTFYQLFSFMEITNHQPFQMFSLKSLDWPFPPRPELNAHFHITNFSDLFRGPSNTQVHLSETVMMPSEHHIQNTITSNASILNISSMWGGKNWQLLSWSKITTMSNLDMYFQLHTKSVTRWHINKPTNVSMINI